MRISTIFIWLSLLSFFFPPPQKVFSQTSSEIQVNSLLQKADISFVPRAATFTEGSTFDIPIMIDTRGQSINAVELYVNFDPRKLQVIESTGQQSIIGIWIAAPSYSNVAGTLKIVGAIPGGINTQSGLIGKITFKAVGSGTARVAFANNSQILSNDGLGTTVVINLGSATYSIIPPAPEGPKVFSETHPFTDKWYNNNTPVIAWEEDPGVTAYSYVVDDKPFTVPDNESSTVENRVSLPDLPNGLSYFHIKARKNGVWGGTTHFLLRIDNLPPAQFTATHERLLSTNGVRAYVYFKTTDSLSGIDHYEVGVLDQSEEPDIVPVFIESKSPYQLPTKIGSKMRVIVRAVDRGGNVRDTSLDIVGNFWIGMMQKNYIAGIAVFFFFIILWLTYSHYRFQRKVVRALRLERARREGLLEPAYNLPSHPSLITPSEPMRYEDVVPYPKAPKVYRTSASQTITPIDPNKSVHTNYSLE